MTEAHPWTCSNCRRVCYPEQGESDCRVCHLCFDCALPTCKGCGDGPAAKLGPPEPPQETR